MSKKKREAKFARISARRALLGRRADAALARFRAEFPSPYQSEEEHAADRDLFVTSRRAVAADDVDGAELPAFLESDGDSWLFAEWVLDYADALMKSYGSEEQVDARVRFQLADLVLRDIDDERRKEVGPDHLKVMSVFIRKLPLFPLQANLAEGTDLGEPEPPK
jgi:hypothetical protein